MEKETSSLLLEFENLPEEAVEDIIRSMPKMSSEDRREIQDYFRQLGGD